MRAGPVAMTTSEGSSTPKPFLDRFGALASGLCAVHCATSAFLPSLLAAAGLSALLGHEAEWAFTLLAIGVAGAAMFLSLRADRATWIVVAFAVGIGGLLTSRLAEEAEAHTLGTVVGILSGLLLVLAHLANIRAIRRPKNA